MGAHARFFQLIWIVCICLAPYPVQAGLTELVQKVQPAVVMLTTFDIDGEISGIGSGFFVEESGELITNFHVLKDAYAAEAKTLAGEKYRIGAVIASDEAADLIKVKISAGNRRFPVVRLSEHFPVIAEKIVVVGSPLGLDQTVSEGIVSAIRKMPSIGNFFQMSAPISPGSSGSPVMNMSGDVIGVATFQAATGQNLNFAVSSRSVLEINDDLKKPSLSEWTYARSMDKPRVAAELCRKGFQFSIQGEGKKALQYYREAAEKDPRDAAAWYGLGSCYVGLDRADDALKAYRQAILHNPRDALAHYHLASYYGNIGRNEDAITSYREVIHINPEFRQAYFRLGIVYTRIGRLEEGKEAFQQVVRLDPENARAHFMMGITYGKMGRYEDALQAHREVLRINPNHAAAHYNMGLAYAMLSDPQKEMESYRQAIRIDPDFAPAHLKIGQRYDLNGDKAAALAQYKILKQLDDQMANRLFDFIYR